MTLRLSNIVGFLLLFFATSFSASYAQGYSVVINCPQSISGRLRCILYNDSTTTTFRPRIQEGEATLTGNLQRPSLMQILHPQLKQPLSFYLENANIVINLNEQSPNASPITGSRTNSRYRYALEINNPDYNPDWLTQLIQENATEIFAPFILSQYANTLPFSTLQKLYNTLSGEAISTYHYRWLTKHLHQQQATIEGAIMPDFVFNDQPNHPIHFDSIHSPQKPSVVLFTASWCQQCHVIEEQLKKEFPQLQTIIVPIDAHPKQWDAPYMKQLSVDRIPYMILLDKNKEILTRDARIWELQRLLNTFGLNPSKQP